VDHQPFHVTARASAKGPSPVKHDPPVSVQFGLRTLLLLLTVVSVLFAALAPYVLRMETRRQWIIAGSLIAFLLGMSLGVIITTYRSRRAQPRRRESLLTLPVHGRKMVGWSELMLPVCISLLIGINVFLGFSHEIRHSTLSREFHLMTFPRLAMIAAGGMLFSQWVLAYWWKLHTLFFCEHGIYYEEFKFGTWNQAKLRHWSMEDGSLSLKLKRILIQDTVPEEHRQQLDEILKHYLPECAPDPGV
jgi:hypothetical protein